MEQQSKDNLMQDQGTTKTRFRSKIPLPTSHWSQPKYVKVIPDMTLSEFETINNQKELDSNSTEIAKRNSSFALSEQSAVGKAMANDSPLQTELVSEPNGKDKKKSADPSKTSFFQGKSSAPCIVAEKADGKSICFNGYVSESAINRENDSASSSSGEFTEKMKLDSNLKTASFLDLTAKVEKKNSHRSRIPMPVYGGNVFGVFGELTVTGENKMPGPTEIPMFSGGKSSTSCISEQAASKKSFCHNEDAFEWSESDYVKFATMIIPTAVPQHNLDVDIIENDSSALVSEEPISVQGELPSELASEIKKTRIPSNCAGTQNNMDLDITESDSSLLVSEESTSVPKSPYVSLQNELRSELASEIQKTSVLPTIPSYCGKSFAPHIVEQGLNNKSTLIAEDTTQNMMAISTVTSDHKNITPAIAPTSTKDEADLDSTDSDSCSFISADSTLSTNTFESFLQSACTTDSSTQTNMVSMYKASPAVVVALTTAAQTDTVQTKESTSQTEHSLLCQTIVDTNDSASQTIAPSGSMLTLETATQCYPFGSWSTKKSCHATLSSTDSSSQTALPIDSLQRAACSAQMETTAAWTADSLCEMSAHHVKSVLPTNTTAGFYERSSFRRVLNCCLQIGVVVAVRFLTGIDIDLTALIDVDALAGRVPCSIPFHDHQTVISAKDRLD